MRSPSDPAIRAMLMIAVILAATALLLCLLTGCEAAGTSADHPIYATCVR